MTISIKQKRKKKHFNFQFQSDKQYYVCMYKHLICYTILHLHT